MTFFMIFKSFIPWSGDGEVTITHNIYVSNVHRPMSESWSWPQMGLGSEILTLSIDSCWAWSFHCYDTNPLYSEKGFKIQFYFYFKVTQEKWRAEGDGREEAIWRRGPSKAYWTRNGTRVTATSSVETGKEKRRRSGKVWFILSFFSSLLL